MRLDDDTIAALATPPGSGGIGVVRLSGPAALAIAKNMLPAASCNKLVPRSAVFSKVYRRNAEPIDHGIVLYFQAPQSFTGEDVIEFQCHGGVVVLDSVLTETLRHGARLARPGEFLERAFLNNKIDLAQAEAAADLVNADTDAAAQAALRSMAGEFSKKVLSLVEELVSLRAYIEAAIDFPEEEIDFLADGTIYQRMNKLLDSVNEVFITSRAGSLLREGLKVVITGKPNAGKSSLLNALAAKDVAIVTPIPGTTRDVIREKIQIDGIPLHIIDTAGIRESEDVVEKEGVRRAQQEISAAQAVLFVVDGSTSDRQNLEPPCGLPPGVPVLTILNKADLFCPQPANKDVIVLSAKTGEGVDRLRDRLKALAGGQSASAAVFSARRRHLDALEKAAELIRHGVAELTHGRSGELVAEDLRLAQQSLESITGRFLPDDLLEKIFRDFCIGK